jgi:hypothetical protein
METQPRLDVLYASLSLEHATSLILGELLDIDPETSKTLGSKSSSFSFKNKIDLITDMRALESEDATKLLCFAEIRNQFIHNLKVDTYTSCFKNLQGKDKYLKKLYGLTDESNLTEEQLLSEYFNSLAKDLIGIIGKLFNEVMKKYYEQGKNDGRKLFGELMIETMSQIEIESPDSKKIFDEVFIRTNEKYDKESKDLKAHRLSKK